MGSKKRVFRNEREKRVKILLVEFNLQQVDVANYMKISKQNLHARLKRGDTAEIVKAIYKLASTTPSSELAHAS